MKDMFGNDVPEYEKITAETMKAANKRKRRPTKPNGYASVPGTGPAGEFCRTCVFKTSVEYARKYIKCFANKAHWTGGPGSDIRAGSPACKRWREIPQEVKALEKEVQKMERENVPWAERHEIYKKIEVLIAKARQ
jgi:hypothetical protein